jgi:hypothetical protein
VKIGILKVSSGSHNYFDFDVITGVFSLTESLLMNKCLNKAVSLNSLQNKNLSTSFIKYKTKIPLKNLC